MLGKKRFPVVGGEGEEEFGLVQMNKSREMESRGCRYVTNCPKLVCHPSNTTSPLAALDQASVSGAKAEGSLAERSETGAAVVSWGWSWSCAVV